MQTKPTTRTEHANQSFCNLLGVDTAKRNVLGVTLKIRPGHFPLLIVHELAPDLKHPYRLQRFRLVPDGEVPA